MLKMEMDKGINKTTSKENGEKTKAWKIYTENSPLLINFPDFNMYVTTHKYENEYFVI